jgi:hypothetical protein
LLIIQSSSILYYLCNNLYNNNNNNYNNNNAHSMAERSDSSTYSKCCGNLQANNHSHSSRNSRLLIIIRSIYYPINVSNIVVLAVCCKIVYFVFRILPLFNPELPACFRFYIFQIIGIYFSRILQP